MTFAFSQAKRIQKLEKEMKFLKQAYQPVTEQRRFHQESMEERRQKFTQLQTSKQVICGTHSSGEKM
jgi:phage shock protein A